MGRRAGLSALVWLALAGAGRAAPDIVELQPNEAKPIYFQINLSGEVHLRIRDEQGPACLDLWWVTYPLGRVVRLGRRCDVVSLDAPGAFSLAFAASLRARAEGRTTRVAIESKLEPIVKLGTNF